MVKNQQQCWEIYLSIISSALAALWTEVNVTGFQTTSSNSSIIVGSDPTTTVLTPSSITTTDAFLLQSMTVGSDPTETVVTPSSVTSTNAFLETIVLRDVSGDIGTLTESSTTVLTPSSITVGSDPTTTVITPSSITTTDAFLETVVLRDVSGDIITLDYGNEFLQLQTQLYQFIAMCLGFGISPNMQSLNAAYSTFLSNIQSKYGNQYQSLPWLYNPDNISSSLLFYNPNFSDFFWIFFNSLAFSRSVYQNWYSLTPFTVAPYNSYTVPATTTDASGTVSANANRAVFNIFFYNEGTGYYTPGGTYPNTSTTYTFTNSVSTIAGNVSTVYRTTTPYGICGISTNGALTQSNGLLSYSTTVSIAGIGGSNGALGAISQGVLFGALMPQAANTRYRSQQFFNVTGSIKDLLGSNAGNPNCFAYYDANYVGTNTTGYRPLDIWCVSGTQTISNSTIIYQYIGFIINSSTLITISGNNILFKNCVFNVLGRTAGVFSITGSNVVFDNCLFRNLVTNETWNYSTNAVVASSQLTGSTILVSTALSTTSSLFYFINNYINFNVNDALYYNNATQFIKNIVSISTGSASTQAQNYYVCNNTLESTWSSNPFQSSTGAGVMTIQSTLFSSNTGIINVYYQLNTHLAQENYIFDVRAKDYLDLYINATGYLQQTNVTIYFLDRYINEGSNFLKVLLNYDSGYVLFKRTSTTPFLYYNIE